MTAIATVSLGEFIVYIMLFIFGILFAKAIATVGGKILDAIKELRFQPEAVIIQIERLEDNSCWVWVENRTKKHHGKSLPEALGYLAINQPGVFNIQLTKNASLQKGQAHEEIPS